MNIFGDNMSKTNKKKKNRSLWFRGLTNFMKLFIKKPTFKFLGEEIEEGSIILSNHLGTTAPLSCELYLNTPFRFWGAYEMNGNLASVYRYMTKTYYHEKKHWNLTAARLFCILASPVSWVFYRGLRLISTYKDHRFRHTLQESLKTIKNKESIILFPEDSTTGYHDTLEGFYAGFMVLAKLCYMNGIDVPIYLAYLRKSDRTYIIDKQVKYSELIKDGKSDKEIATLLCNRINEISNM